MLKNIKNYFSLCKLLLWKVQDLLAVLRIKQLEFKLFFLAWGWQKGQTLLMGWRMSPFTFQCTYVTTTFTAYGWRASFLLQLLTCLRKMQSVDIFSEACNFLIPLDNLHVSPYFFSKNLHCIFSLFLLIFLSPSPSSLTKFFNNFSTIWSHVFNMNWKHE